nr:hypothetical protein [Tanacetum cinerariifolium]
IPACCDDDDDYDSAITPVLSTEEPVKSLSMGDEHLDTIPTTESDEFIKSYVETLVPDPSEFEGENGCDVPFCFTTFSNILFDDEYEFNSVDDQSLHNEEFSKKIFLNPLFEEEIISIKKNQHLFNAESDLVESMLNRDSSIISSSSKIDSLLDEFAGELTLLKSIPPGIDKTDCHPENEIRLSQRLLYDNSSPRPPEEFNSENSNAKIESFSPSPIPNEDSDSFMEEIDLFLNPNDPMPQSIEDDEDSERDILFLERLLHDDPIPLPDTLDFSYEVRIFLPFFTYLVTSPVLLSFGGITINHFYSLKPGSSHRHGAFKKFNTHRSHLNEWPMIMNGKNTPHLDYSRKFEDSCQMILSSKSSFPQLQLGIILGGHWDHLSGCLAHMLYCIVAEEQYNLAYFFAKRTVNARATTTAIMHPLALKQTRKPRSNRDIRKGRHSVSSSSSHQFRSSSHQGNDDDDERTSRASTSFPTSYLNSLSPLNYQTYNISTTSQ